MHCAVAQAFARPLPSKRRSIQSSGPPVCRAALVVFAVRDISGSEASYNVVTHSESITLRDFLISSVTATAGESTPLHQHTSPAFLAILSGTINDGGRILREGSIVSRTAPFAHALGSESDRSAFVCVAVHGASAGHVHEVHGDRTPAAQLIALRMASDLRLTGPTRAVSLRSTVLRLIAWSAAPATVQCNEAVDSAQRFIDQHFFERVALTGIASFCGIDPSRLARDYRRTFGMTIGEAIRIRRLTRAAELLSTTTRSLAYIARASGFFDASHLTRAWCAALGSAHDRLR